MGTFLKLLLMSSSRRLKVQLFRLLGNSRGNNRSMRKYSFDDEQSREKLAPKGVSPQSLAVGSIAKEYKNKLAVAGTKAMNSTKRITPGLSSAFLIYPSDDKDRTAIRVGHSSKQ